MIASFLIHWAIHPVLWQLTAFSEKHTGRLEEGGNEHHQMTVSWRWENGEDQTGTLDESNSAQGAYPCNTLYFYVLGHYDRNKNPSCAKEDIYIFTGILLLLL